MAPVKDDCDDDKLTKALQDIAVLHERLANRDKALEIQAIEYERRLAVLNHAHQEAVDRNAMYVTRELHDQLASLTGDRLNDVTLRLVGLERTAVTISQVGGLVIGASIVVGAVIAILEHFVLK